MTSDAASVVLTVAGDVGAHDVSVLRRCLEAELAIGTSTPRIVVVILTDVTSFAPGLPELLGTMRRRARELGSGLHLLDFGRSRSHRLIEDGLP